MDLFTITHVQVQVLCILYDTLHNYCQCTQFNSYLVQQKSTFLMQYNCFINRQDSRFIYTSCVNIWWSSSRLPILLLWNTCNSQKTCFLQICQSVVKIYRKQVESLPSNDSLRFTCHNGRTHVNWKMPTLHHHPHMTYLECDFATTSYDMLIVMIHQCSHTNDSSLINSTWYTQLHKQGCICISHLLNGTLLRQT